MGRDGQIHGSIFQFQQRNKGKVAKNLSWHEILHSFDLARRFL
jgi:hypothetical protein